MLKWLGLTTLLLGLVAFGIFGFLGLVWYEPPIEALSVLAPGRKPGEVNAGKLTESEYWFEVAGLDRDTTCSLIARRADGSEVFRETSKKATDSGCRGSGKPIAGETWTLEFTAGTPGAYVKAYQSHGDGFPYLGAILLACILLSVIGTLTTVIGVVRKRA